MTNAAWDGACFEFAAVHCLLTLPAFMLIDRLTEEVLLALFLTSYALNKAGFLLKQWAVVIECVDPELFGHPLPARELWEIPTAVLRI